jgi:hypothetical protein
MINLSNFLCISVIIGWIELSDGLKYGMDCRSASNMHLQSPSFSIELDN